MPVGLPQTARSPRIAAAVGACLRSRALFAAETSVILALGAALALWLQPVPHSDWAYYWSAAGDPARYERGGVGLWLLALPKAAGWSPATSALLLNLVSATCILLFARTLDRTRLRWCSHLVALYLLLITPYFGIVQLDLVGAALLAAGFRILLQPPSGWGHDRCFAAAALAFAAGVSTRPQFALTLWAMIGLAALALLLGRRRHALAGMLLGTMLAGSLAGFGLDAGMRAAGERTETMRTSSAVTLYGGLLVSGTGPRCGYWSPAATSAARADLAKPLPQAIADRLRAAPPRHWLAVMRCKLPEILQPRPYALGWLLASPGMPGRIGDAVPVEHPESIQRRILKRERRLYRILTAAILLSTAGTCVFLWRRRATFPGLLPATWVASFWIVHLVFEIQGRYFLAMLLLAPLLSAGALRIGHSNAAR